MVRAWPGYSRRSSSSRTRTTSPPRSPSATACPLKTGRRGSSRLDFQTGRRDDGVVCWRPRNVMRLGPVSKFSLGVAACVFVAYVLVRWLVYVFPLDPFDTRSFDRAAWAAGDAYQRRGMTRD